MVPDYLYTAIIVLLKAKAMPQQTSSGSQRAISPERPPWRKQEQQLEEEAEEEAEEEDDYDEHLHPLQQLVRDADGQSHQVTVVATAAPWASHGNRGVDKGRAQDKSGALL